MDHAISHRIFYTPSRGRPLRMWLVLTLLVVGLAPAMTTGGQEGITQSTGELDQEHRGRYQCGLSALV